MGYFLRKDKKKKGFYPQMYKILLEQGRQAGKNQMCQIFWICR